MTDADTQAAEAVSPVAAFVAGTGLVPEPRVVDAAGLGGVAGPLLTADLVSPAGNTVGVVAVLDDPATQPDQLLQSLADAAATESGGGTAVEPGSPVADGSELAARFPMPVTVAAFGDGGRVRAMLVTPIERRANPAAGGAVPGRGDAGRAD